MKKVAKADGSNENHFLILITTIGTLLCKPSLYQTHDDDNDDILKQCYSYIVKYGTGFLI